MDQDILVQMSTILTTILEAIRIIIPTGPLLIKAVKVSATDFINQMRPRINFLSPDHGLQVEDPAIEVEEDLEAECKMEEEEELQMQECIRHKLKISLNLVKLRQLPATTEIHLRAQEDTPVLLTSTKLL